MICEWFRRKTDQRPKGYSVIDMPYTHAIEELGLAGIVWQVKVRYIPDTLLRYTTLLEWERIAPFLVSPADRYVLDITDCDDYAKMASAKAAMEFGLNGCLECWGTVDNEHAKGSHAFNLVKTTQGYFLMEPNAGFPYAGELFRIGQHGYLAKSWR